MPMTSIERSLQSDRHEVTNAIAANELFQQSGWTDGLPIVPPTAERVQEFLAQAGIEPETVVGTEPVRRRRLTAEKLAINSVMAGCLPEYFPVVIAAIEAMCQEEFCL